MTIPCLDDPGDHASLTDAEVEAIWRLLRIHPEHTDSDPTPPHGTPRPI